MTSKRFPYCCPLVKTIHDDVIKWKHFPRYWPFVRGIHRSPVNSPHKGQWRGALMFSLICTRINGWVNNGEAGDLRRHRHHYDVIVMPLATGHGYMDFSHDEPVMGSFDVILVVILNKLLKNSGVAGDLASHDAHVTSRPWCDCTLAVIGCSAVWREQCIIFSSHWYFSAKENFVTKLVKLYFRYWKA